MESDLLGCFLLFFLEQMFTLSKTRVGMENEDENTNRTDFR